MNIEIENVVDEHKLTIYVHKLKDGVDISAEHL